MFDLLVVGGGLVGLATARQYLSRHPGRSVCLLEKESHLAAHQSGRNSGVLHSGIYYAPGSQKAENCRRGKALMEAFCERRGVPYRRCGKLIVATDEGQLSALAVLRDKGQRNGVELEELDEAGIRRLEPHVGGLAALHVPATGIVDFPAVATALAAEIRSSGGEIQLDRRVTHLENSGGRARVGSGEMEWLANRVVVCGGLQADRLAGSGGESEPVRIVPFLGEYRALRPEFAARVERLIYPVPDPRFPFLGVHVTPRIDGRVDCGPNALPTMSREGYSKRAVDLRDAWSCLSWPGFWKLVGRQWPMARAELVRSLSSAAFARAIGKLLPGASAEWFEDAPAGVRAQALDRRGELVDDYLIQSDGAILHLLNAPSPAATSCLAIGEHLVERLASETG